MFFLRGNQNFGNNTRAVTEQGLSANVTAQPFSSPSPPPSLKELKWQALT